jgi:hypothetical protein
MGQSEPTRNLALELVRVTEAAAFSAGRLMGGGWRGGQCHAACPPDGGYQRGHRHRRGREG